MSGKIETQKIVQSTPKRKVRLLSKTKNQLPFLSILSVLTLLMLVSSFFLTFALQGVLQGMDLGSQQPKGNIAHESVDYYEDFVPNNTEDAPHWKDVVYNKKIARQIAQVIDHPASFNEYLNDSSSKKHYSVKNMMFHGSPGTGKTFSATAIAKSVSSHYKVVAAGSLQRKYVGTGASEWSNNVDKAKKIARKNLKLGIDKPVFLIVDEIDSLGRAYSSNDHGDDTLINTFLASIDSIVLERLNIVIIGTTNRLELIAPSAKRPGRFNKILFEEIRSSSEDRSALVDCVRREIEEQFAVCREIKENCKRKEILIKESFWAEFKNGNKPLIVANLREQIIIKIKSKIWEQEKKVEASGIELNRIDSLSIIGEIASKSEL